MRVKLTVSYDGTNYAGWQIQKNAVTVQEVLDKELSKIYKRPIRTVGASRTDAGVHALGNVAAYDVESRMPAEKAAFALNAGLPRDIVIQRSEEAAPDFHPRFDAKKKTYVYRILNRPFPLPMKRFDTTFHHYPLDDKAMAEAVSVLKGEHDFTSFASIHAQTNTFVRTIHEAKVVRTPEDVIEITLTGNGFLYNMVRIIAGTLLEIGSGRTAPEEMERILLAKDRNAAGPTAPPEGLTLVEISY